MNKLLTICLVAVGFTVVMASTATSDDYDDATLALGRREYEPARRLLMSLAEQRQPKAAFVLGTLYATGKGVTQDYAEAVNWFRKGAEQGDANAAYSLGYMYGRGLGTPQNRVESARWLLWAAEEGHPSAQYAIAGRYTLGSGVRRDYAAAASWFYRAAEQGIGEAQIILAIMFALGKGVSADNDAAYSWATIAARGQGLKQIRNDALALRESLNKSMTEQRIVAAEKIAKAWVPKSERLVREAN